MSVDEIRRLVRIYSAKEKNLKYELETFKNAKMMPNLENVSIARNDAIMTIQALLSYAAMVERCEEVRAKISKHNKVFREVWGHDDVFDGNKLIDYILKGATDERK